MEIESIKAAGLTESLIPSESATVKPRGEGFGEMLNQGINELSQLQNKARNLTEQMAAGENVELHDVMIAAQESDIALRLATQLRSQAMEAYREIMRMPV